MYLKALVIQGFKSFPEKTTLEFEREITAIVGPNGSGKSNISDALRWVMGEQSTKNLRGGKMEDVIFGGTEKRSPVGFAEVTLVLDNSAHIFDMENTEVSITRRYFRSGDSEYYINRKSCRLRDINELLMDTGLGRDGYSIIGQGRIDEILSVRSTDRREIFEEAAGISRFRYNKEDAERRLERTGENLERINDKISELEMQVEPLRKQSETAKKYLILRDELRGVEISVWCENIDRLRETNRKTETDYEITSRQLEAERENVEKLYAASDELGAKMREMDVSAEAVRAEITAGEAVLAAIDSAIAVSDANVSSCEENISRMNEEMSEQDARIADISSQIGEHDARLAEIEEKTASLEKQSEELAIRTAGLSEDDEDSAKKMEALLKQEADELAEAAKQRSVLAALDSAGSERSLRIDGIASELSHARERLSQEKANEEKSRSALKDAENAAASTENIIKGREMLLQGKREKCGKLGKEKTDLTISCGDIAARVKMLREMEHEYQGFSGAVKTIMRESERGNIRGVHAPVANLLKVGNEYAIAIETALGGAAQNIVVETDADSKNAINLLKRLNAGRNTFMPISSMNGSILRENGLEREEGYIGIASELLSFDEKYRGIFTYLLGRTAVAEDLDSAVRISRKYGKRFRLVTLDGQVVNAGGSMTGGSVAKNIGIISRANELEALVKKQETESGRLAEVNEALKKAERELLVSEDETESARQELRTAQDSILRLRTECEHIKLLCESLEYNIASLENEERSILSRSDEDKAEAEKASENEKQHLAAAAKFREEAEKLSRGRDELRSKSDELSAGLTAIKTEIASLGSEKLTRTMAREELVRLCESISGDREKRTARISELNEQTAQFRAEIAAKQAEREKNARETDKIRDKLSKLIESKLALEAEQTRCLKNGRDKENTLRTLEREASVLEQKKLAAELEEKQLVDKLWDNYELSVTAAQSVRTEIENIKAATKRINELRRSISALGTPNLGAIEEFERVNERYTFLAEQRDDVEKSKAELEHIIRDITSEMKEIFSHEFETINASFKQTFLELFGGGKAELVLEDESDILNCGIEIKVQPPGKSLKTISLLSGGEKAFVAIAIYFAILKVRPTPFCIMDEIEAALDDANVQRFAEYLRNFSDKTQFMIITHRRGTMEGADALFGVTMQEQGVTKVISVDLEEAVKSITE